MAGLAPLGGPSTPTTLHGAAATVPGSITPAYANPQQPSPTGQNQAFTAFPSSYAGFGADGNGFGTLSVVNGALTVLSTPAGSLPPPHTNPDGTPAVGAPPATADSNGATAPAPTTTAGAVANNDQVPNPYTAVPPAPPPPPPPLNQAKTDAAIAQSGSVPGSATTLDAAASTAPGATTAPSSDPASKNPPPGNTGNTGNTGNANNSGTASDPTAGLLGAQPANTVPGSDPPPVNLAQGLLGSPATNPIVIQAEAQDEQAAQAAQQAADEAAQQKAAQQIQVQQLTARISAAYADNNSAAVAQLQPYVTKLEGQIQGQIWAGLGTTPPQPFKLPEVPTVFLNVPT